MRRAQSAGISQMRLSLLTQVEELVRARSLVFCRRSISITEYGILGWKKGSKVVRNEAAPSFAKRRTPCVGRIVNDCPEDGNQTNEKYGSAENKNVITRGRDVSWLRNARR